MLCQGLKFVEGEYPNSSKKRAVEALGLTIGFHMTYSGEYMANTKALTNILEYGGFELKDIIR